LFTGDPDNRVQGRGPWSSMKLFECQNCGQPLYFENTRCESCGLRLGYLPARETITALQPDNELWRALAAPEGRYHFCANAVHGVCNWLVESDCSATVCARALETSKSMTMPTRNHSWGNFLFKG